MGLTLPTVSLCFIIMLKLRILSTDSRDEYQHTVCRKHLSVNLKSIWNSYRRKFHFPEFSFLKKINPTCFGDWGFSVTLCVNHNIEGVTLRTGESCASLQLTSTTTLNNVFTLKVKVLGCITESLKNLQHNFLNKTTHTEKKTFWHQRISPNTYIFRNSLKKSFIIKSDKYNASASYLC